MGFNVNRIILLTFILTPLFATAQGQRAHLHGKITNGKEVEGIHIMNKTSRYNSVTDAYGNFLISAGVLDTLLVSSVKYMPKEVVVTPEDHERGILLIELEDLINQLDEVVIGPRLTGLLETDIEKIPVQEKKNFQDFGIPGFSGTPQERIVPLASALFPTSVQLEALYKHITGYYKKLRLKRMWNVQNQMVARILDHYGDRFITQAYGIPKHRLYDFVLFCVESTGITANFNRSDFAGVLDVLSASSAEYLSRMNQEKE